MAGARNLAVLDVASAMEMCGDDREFLLSLLDELKKVITEKCDDMRIALGACGMYLNFEAADAVYRAAHSLKGGASQLSALALADVASSTQDEGLKCLALLKNPNPSPESLQKEADILRMMLHQIEVEGQRLFVAVDQLHAAS
eukprot:jgi/Chlat1/2795/Chrsp187S02955